MIFWQPRILRDPFSPGFRWFPDWPVKWRSEMTRESLFSLQSCRLILGDESLGMYYQIRRRLLRPSRKTTTPRWTSLMSKSENNSTIRLKRLQFLFNLETLFIRGGDCNFQRGRVGEDQPMPRVPEISLVHLEITGFATSLQGISFFSSFFFVPSKTTDQRYPRPCTRS